MRREAWTSSESSGDNEQTGFNSIRLVWTRTRVEAKRWVRKDTAHQARESCDLEVGQEVRYGYLKVES